MKTISEILQAGGADRPAIGAPDRSSMTYGMLRARTETVRLALRTMGVSVTDRVAIVLPNGPEMAAAFLTIAASASTAPLNPGYRRDEFDFYLGDLKPKILVVQVGDDTPARAAAEAAGIAVVEIEVPQDAEAGFFTLKPSADAAVVDSGPSQAENEALVLHTSGTTSRPKVVPLTGANLAASAIHIRDTLSLTADDTGLNIMPLFHIHGLIASLLSSMSAGAHVVCTPGFNALKIFGWFAEVNPTWYTAVPTMHQTIVARAERNKETLGKMQLRFIRSSSSSLPPPVFAELENTFGVPVIEAYGMTEASHQMASNQLPPGKRKAGTVGPSGGPEIAILDEEGNELERGETGEIVIRGPNVFSGYENNPAANATAFINGWFRTGDQGSFDEDGHLSITGRLKEIINRGGEKIAPREVDDVLQAHSAVAQVVTFAMPHDKLGEDVAAIVVLKEGASATERELREHCAKSLADFKVPRKILFMDEIPKGATGKLQRIGLAQKLGLTA
ncbi:MAG: AMP-binding protein [Chitinophagales bacterium]|nr:AMP-binding protein [Hyphomicrobiales bacterium]